MDFEVHCMFILPTELSLFNYDKVKTVLQWVTPLSGQNSLPPPPFTPLLTHASPTSRYTPQTSSSSPWNAAKPIKVVQLFPSSSSTLPSALMSLCIRNTMTLIEGLVVTLTTCTRCELYYCCLLSSRYTLALLKIMLFNCNLYIVHALLVIPIGTYLFSQCMFHVLATRNVFGAISLFMIIDQCTFCSFFLWVALDKSVY